MGFLSGTKAYLVGPIEHDSGFGRDWRQVADNLLSDLGVKVYNPLDRPKWMAHINQYVPPDKSREEILDAIKQFGTDSPYHKSQEFIRRLCLRFIHSCDFVLCYLSNSKTFGTTEELVIANQAKKPIIMVCPDGIPSLWIYDLIKDQHVFNSLGEALKFINEIDKAEVELDLFKWIFLNQEYPNLELESRYVW